MKCVRAAACALVAISGWFAASALAQGFPARPVRYLMPLPAGSETDLFGRVLTKELSEGWSQQVVVENRPGASTTIATEAAAKSPPDGYTVLHAITSFAINPALYARLPYDTLKDFSCVTQVGNLYAVLLAHPSFPANSIPELVRLARARPGEIAYASGGTGTVNHIAAEAMRAAAGIDIVHIPYKGSSLAALDVVPGRVPLLSTVLVEAVPFIQARKLKVIATTSPRRAPSLPDVPTVGESLPGYRVGNGFWAVVTRAGTPPAILARLHADVLKAMQAGEVRKRLAIADVEIVASAPGECDAFLHEQVSLWRTIVKASGARVD